MSLSDQSAKTFIRRFVYLWAVVLALLAFAPVFAAPAYAQAIRKNVANLTAAEVMALRRGVGVMMARNNAPRDSADFRRSWVYWANLHAYVGPGCRSGTPRAGTTTWETTNPTEEATWCGCEHGTDQFLTWHRMALFYFERVLQQAAGTTALRLPYWDVEAQPTLPRIFRDRTYVNEQGQTVPNPLFVPTRNSNINAGTGSISLAGRTNPPLTGPYGTFRQRVENAPHGTVHVAVGGMMPSVPASANDPIFWLHHTNVDRLYELWLAGGGVVPTGLFARQYSFIDRDGSMVTRRVGEMLTAAVLGYRYQAGSR